MFRKPDSRTPSLTFSFIPKSAILGICGAMLGLEGYTNGKSPVFLSRLKDFKIAIEPYINGKPATRPFSRTFVKFNNYHGYGSADGNDRSIEQVLIRPSYLISVIADEQNQDFQTLSDCLKKKEIKFRPYLGKNEFLANIEPHGVLNAGEVVEEQVKCDSIYAVNNYHKIPLLGGTFNFLISDTYSYGLDDHQRHKLAVFNYSDWKIQKDQVDSSIGRLYALGPKGERVIFGF